MFQWDRIFILVNATIKNALLDCKASGTGKDVVKVVLVITTYTHMQFRDGVLFMVITHENMKRSH